MTPDTDTLFAELVSAHGEENGGIEDFFLIDTTTIGCRYGDCCISLRHDGWHYGGSNAAHLTPREAYEHRRCKNGVGIIHDSPATPQNPTETNQ